MIGFSTIEEIHFQPETVPAEMAVPVFSIQTVKLDKTGIVLVI